MRGTHHFNPLVAAEVGLAAAVIFDHIEFWCDYNKDNPSCLHEGRVWSFTSVSRITERMAYLSTSQVRTALSKLIDAGFIGEGNFNKNAYDRTKWYCVLRTFDLSEIANDDAGDREPILDTELDTETNTPKPPEGAGSLFDLSGHPCMEGTEHSLENEFNSWWTNEYPERKRSHSKALARKAYLKHRKTVTKEAIWAATLDYFNELVENNTDPDYVKMATTFLNSEPWVK